MLQTSIKYATVADRVRQYGTVVGTGDVTMAATGQDIAGFRPYRTLTFDGASRIGVSPYCIEELNAEGVPTGKWEVGIGGISINAGVVTLKRCYGVIDSDVGGNAKTTFANETSKVVSLVGPAGSPPKVFLYLRTGTEAAWATGASVGEAFTDGYNASRVASALNELGAAVRIDVGSGEFGVYWETAGYTVDNEIFAAGIDSTTFSDLGVFGTGNGAGGSVSLYGGCNCKRLSALKDGKIYIQDAVKFVVFDSGGDPGMAHVTASDGGYVYIPDYQVSGAPGTSGYHLLAKSGGKIECEGTMTRSNSWTVATFAYAVDRGSIIYLYGAVSGSGTITGKRHASEDQGLIRVAGASSTFFPGSVAGTTARGGAFG